MVRGGLKLEINIPSQRIRAKRKGGLINEGGVISSEYGKYRDSTTTAEAITTIQTQNNNISHSVLYPPLIVIVELELFFSDSQTLQR